jgi:uncharacterized cupredoxin-like copper-binding protein
VHSMKKGSAVAVAAAVSVSVVGVGTALASDQSTGNTRPIVVKLSEMAITPSTLKARAGRVTFEVTNVGKTTHELVVIRTKDAPGKLPLTGSTASETGNVGETGDLGAGKSKTFSLDLTKGRYVVICNVPGHYMAGMRGALVVS